MRTDRPSFEGQLVTLSKYSEIIRAFEEDMQRRRCVIPAATAKLKWQKVGGSADPFFRITTPTDQILSDQPAKVRAAVSEADLEALADAADQAMVNLFANETPVIPPVKGGA